MLWQTITEPQRLTPCGEAVMPGYGRAFDERHSNKSIRSRAT